MVGRDHQPGAVERVSRPRATLKLLPLLVLGLIGCRGGGGDVRGDVSEVQELGGALPCESVDVCAAGYRDYAKRAGKGSTAVSASRLQRLGDELYNLKPMAPADAPPPDQLRPILAEQAGLTELLAGLDERRLGVAVLQDEPWPGGRKLLLRFDDPWVGRFTALLLLPDGPGPHPAVIAHPGHGEDAAWTLDNRFGAAFPAAGVALVVLEARVHAGDEFGSEVTRELLLRGRPLVGLRAYEILLLDRYLRSRADIDAARVGLVGHSGGSLVVNLAMWLQPRFAALATDLFSGYWSVDDEGKFIDESAVGLVLYQDILADFSPLGRPVLKARYAYPDGGEGQILPFFTDAFGLPPLQVDGLVRGCVTRQTCTAPYLGAAQRAARSVVGGVSTGGDAPPLPGIAVLSWLLTDLRSRGSEFVFQGGVDYPAGEPVPGNIADEFVGNAPALLFRPSGATRGGVVLHPGRGPHAESEATARQLAAAGWATLLLQPRVTEADALEVELHRALEAGSTPLHGLRAYELLAGAAALRADEQLGVGSVVLVGRCYGADLARFAVTLEAGADALVELRPEACPTLDPPLNLGPPDGPSPVPSRQLCEEPLTPDVLSGLLAP